jgi:hypothetical protein
MNRTILMSTAALMAALTYASAQNMPSVTKSDDHPREHAGQSSRSAPPAAHMRRDQLGRQPERSSDPADEKAHQTTGQGRGNSQPDARKAKGGADQTQPRISRDGRTGKTTGQAQSSKSDRATQGEPRGKQGRSEMQQEKQSGQTTGQAQHDSALRSGAKGKQAEPRRDNAADSNKTTGQAQRDQGRQNQSKSGGQNSNRQTQRGQAGESGQRGQAGERAQAQESRSSGRVELTTDERTRLRQRVFAQAKPPRVDHVNFSLKVGTRVPTRVHAAAVPGTLVEIRPEFRDDLFFVVRDEIVVLDHSRRIVALIPTGVSHASGNASAGAGLSTEEIRRVQLVLIERGFLNGHADGVLGPRTREALIAFQRHEGLQVSREIDTQTIAALGLSEEFGKKGRAAAAGRQPSTVGAGGDRTPSNGRGEKNQNREQNQKQTHREKQNRRVGQQGINDASPASTSGQGDRRSPAHRDRTGQPNNHSGSNHSGRLPVTTGQGGKIDHIPAPRADSGKDKAASPNQNNSGNVHSPVRPK